VTWHHAIGGEVTSYNPDPLCTGLARWVQEGYRDSDNGIHPKHGHCFEHVDLHLTVFQILYTLFYIRNMKTFSLWNLKKCNKKKKYQKILSEC